MLLEKVRLTLNQPCNVNFYIFSIATPPKLDYVTETNGPACVQGPTFDIKFLHTVRLEVKLLMKTGS
jgi:hypothetical protein